MFFNFPTFRIVLLLSTLLRIALILYSEWHDAHSVVKYTDVDYRVFSDAAHFLFHPELGEDNTAKGPYGRWFGIGDPYTRQTFRYTPLLAVLLGPNEWVHPSFGKYLFSGCDLLNGVLIYKLLVSVILPMVAASSVSTRANSKNGSILDAPPVQEATIPTLATLYTSLHLLNPLIFTISTRGSSESILASFILLTLYCAFNGFWDAAAILLGASTHWKIYPLIYGVGCLAVVGDENRIWNQVTSNTRDGKGAGWVGYARTIINWRTGRFAVLSAGTFCLLGVLCYLVWGYPFVYESYLYHMNRRDHRHNFSPYFYLTYLTYPSSQLPSTEPVMLPLWRKLIRSPLASFVPQMTLALGAGLLFGRRREDLILTWFVQTVVFVLFNKVCTSQYFLWYLILLPLLLPFLRISPWRGVAYLSVWIGAQGLWLAEAYKLEFLGERVFFGLWVRSCVYVLGNAWVLKEIMGSYRRQRARSKTTTESLKLNTHSVENAASFHE